jgi:nicotinamide phosphoribosyltransferase
MYLKEYLSKPITMEMIDEAEAFWSAHGEPFNRAGWEHIVRVHGGYLPVSIKAVREGTVLPTKNVLVTIVNTDPACWWLTTHLETALLRAVWYPTTVASNSFACKRVIRQYLTRTSDDVEGQLPFKLHDFGARGVSSMESAAIGGLAHLVNFMGTDTATAILAGQRYYGAGMIGYSIPAAEHSTITSWGRDGEVDAYRNMIRQFSKPGSLYAVVSDSYDFEHAVEHIWGETLRDEVVAGGGTLVVRPDSGDPTIMPVWAVEKLGDKFGYTLNSKGYRVLNNVRVIQGDGINYNTLSQILGNLTVRGYAADNIAFGMGGMLLQGVDRDTLKFAMKCSAICINGVWQNVQKDPKTDPGKKSKAGRLALVREDGEYRTVPLEGNEDRDELVEVFRNGRLLVDYTFDEVRAQANVA